MRRIGIIDTGSNTIRLVVFDVPHSTSEVRNLSSLQVVNMKKTAGLSNYVKGGEFTESGIDKASRTLTQLLQCAHNLNCTETYIFATAVLRNVSNSAQAIASIEENTGASIELLSGTQEASLGFLGAFFGKKVSAGTLLIDLGGGSCEITRCDGSLKVSGKVNLGELLQTTSLKIGCVSAYSRFVSRIFPDEPACTDIRAAIRLELSQSASLCSPEKSCRESPTVTALTGVERSLEPRRDASCSLGINCSKSGLVTALTGVCQSDHVSAPLRHPERAKRVEGSTYNNEPTAGQITPEKNPEAQAYGIGGSVRAIAKIMREVSKTYKTPKVITREDILQILDRLHENPDAFAHTVVRAVPDRIHSVIPGSLIILEVMEATGVHSVNICKRGLREGYLLQKLQVD